MRIRKAILTGGGRATRLHPITTTINKHLLPLANKPMIFHVIEKAVEAGIEEIFINTNPGETELQKHIGDGGHWGIKITFFEQVGGPQGIAHVVKQAERFIGNDPFMFYLSDNVLLGSLKPAFDTFYEGNYDCLLTLSKVEDARSFGVPIYNDAGELIDVHEKPSHPPNNFAVTGIYFYGSGVFFDTFDRIEKSTRGEYEISSIHSLFLKEGKRVGTKEITGWWKDTGQFADLLIANRLLLEKMEEHDFPNHGTVEDGATITGNVHVGRGSCIAKDVIIQGPVIIGENCILESCHIGPFATIGTGCVVKRARIEDSIILDNTEIDTDVHLHKSLIGKNVRLIRKSHDEPHSVIIGDKSQLEH